MNHPENEPEIDCVNKYFDCLRDIQGEDHPHLSAAKVQVYLAKEEDGDIHMGIAAQRNIWDFENKAFDEIKGFVFSL
jgi:hypothetical protein